MSPLVRVDAHTQILDPPHVQEVLIRALSATEAFARFQEAIDPTPAPIRPASSRTQPKAKELEQWHETVVDARIQHILGFPLDGAIAAGAMLGKLLGSDVHVRVFPCGEGHPAFRLVGPPSDKPGYFRDDRTSLFAKYGLQPSLWTVVAQIATIPTKEVEAASTKDPIESNDARAHFLRSACKRRT